MIMDAGDSNGDDTVGKRVDGGSRDLTILEKNQLEAKAELDQQKNEILNSLPKEYKDNFGAIGFGKWGKRWLPALIRGPYDVGPGSVRNQWMKMYGNMKQTNRLESLSYLVYWYGARKKEDFYGFVAKTGFIPYDDKKKLAKHKVSQTLSATIQEKMDSGKPLTSTEEETMLAFKEIQEDMAKKPEDRKRGDIEFPESWQLLTMKDVLEAINEGDSDKDGKTKKEKSQPKLKGNTTSKKRKRSSEGEEEKESSEPKRRTSKSKRIKETQMKSSIGEANDVPRKKHQKVKKKGNGDRTEEVSQEEKTFKLCQQAYDSTIQTWKSLIKNKEVSHIIQHLKKSVKDQVSSYSSTYMVRSGLKDLVIQTKTLFDGIPKDDGLAKAALQFNPLFDKIMAASAEPEENDKESNALPRHADDDDLVNDDVSTDYNEKDGDDFEPEPSSSVKKKKTSKKDAAHGKAKLAKKKQKVKHEVPGKTRKRNLKPVVSRWKSALLAKDVHVVCRCLMAVQDGVKDSILDNAIFTEMAGLIKDTRVLLNLDHNDLSLLNDAKHRLKDLKQKLKELYYANGNVGQPKKAASRPIDSEIDSSDRGVPMKTNEKTLSDEALGSNDTDKKKKRNDCEEKDSSGDAAGEQFKLTKTNSKEGAQEKNPPQTSFPAPKIERPKIVLGSFMKLNSKPSAIAETKTEPTKEHATIESSTDFKDVVKQTPSWMIEAKPPLQPIEARRRTAIAFLLDSEVTANAESLNFQTVCQSIEHAVFHWAKDTFNASDWGFQYWSKIHALVAALSSSRVRKECLVKRIEKQEFQAAAEILALDLESMTDSFEKFPMVASVDDSLK